MWLFRLTTFSQADGISSSMSKRKPGNYLLDRLMLGWKCKELENNDDFVFPWLCLQMFWCRKSFTWMTKKKFSFHFSSERIKLQKFVLSFKMKVPKNCTRIKNRQFAISSYLTCDQAFLRVALKSADGGRAKKRSLSVNSSVILCYALSITKNHCG